MKMVLRKALISIFSAQFFEKQNEFRVVGPGLTTYALDKKKIAEKIETSAFLSAIFIFWGHIVWLSRVVSMSRIRPA